MMQIILFFSSSHDFIGEFTTSYKELCRGQSQLNIYEVRGDKTVNTLITLSVFPQGRRPFCKRVIAVSVLYVSITSWLL